jgi:hypothetical protein
VGLGRILVGRYHRQARSGRIAVGEQGLQGTGFAYAIRHALIGNGPLPEASRNTKATGTRRLKDEWCSPFTRHLSGRRLRMRIAPRCNRQTVIKGDSDRCARRYRQRKFHVIPTEFRKRFAVKPPAPMTPDTPRQWPVDAEFSRRVEQTRRQLARIRRQLERPLLQDRDRPTRRSDEAAREPRATRVVRARKGDGGGT